MISLKFVNVVNPWKILTETMKVSRLISINLAGLKGGFRNQISALGKQNWPECHWSKQTEAIFCRPEVQAQQLCTTDLQQQLKTVPLKILDSYSYQKRLLKGDLFWEPKISDIHRPYHES